jgi:peptide/nickel transport system permease protein
MITTWGARRKARIDELAAGRSLTAEAFARLRRNPVAITGAVIVGVFLVVAVLAPLIAPHGATDVFPELQRELRPGHIPGPQPGFPLGSDDLARDFYSRMILGAQQTLVVGVVATLIGLVVGIVIGLLAGAFGGWVDTVLMRVTDVLLAIPSLLLAISVAALAPSPSQTTVIIAVAIVNVPIFARLLRGTLRHMLPNAIGVVIVQATLTLATSILDAAALSFLGLGDADPARAEWGLMLARAQPYLEFRPGLAFWPAIAIIIVALGFTLLGESLREALDPKGRR